MFTQTIAPTARPLNITGTEYREIDPTLPIDQIIYNIKQSLPQGEYEINLIKNNSRFYAEIIEQVGH